MGAHYRLDDFSIGTEQDINVENIIVHEQYHNPLTYSNDIALIKLAKPAKLRKGVGLVCFPNPNVTLPFDIPDKRCYITGWGTLSSGGSQPKELMEASVPLVSKGRCQGSYPGKIGESMLCAGLDKGGVDACQGDSGGPLVCDYNGKWHLEGATSWGYGCAAAGKYGVYAKIRYLASWIRNKMENDIIPPTTVPTRLTTAFFNLTTAATTALVNATTAATTALVNVTTAAPKPTTQGNVS